MMFLYGGKSGNAILDVKFVADVPTDGLPNSITLYEAPAGVPLAPFIFWAPKGTIQVIAHTTPGDSITSLIARAVSLLTAD